MPRGRPIRRRRCPSQSSRAAVWRACRLRQLTFFHGRERPLSPPRAPSRATSRWQRPNTAESATRSARIVSWRTAICSSASPAVVVGLTQKQCTIRTEQDWPIPCSFLRLFLFWNRREQPLRLGLRTQIIAGERQCNAGDIAGFLTLVETPERPGNCEADPRVEWIELHRARQYRNDVVR